MGDPNILVERYKALGWVAEKAARQHEQSMAAYSEVLNEVKHSEELVPIVEKQLNPYMQRWKSIVAKGEALDAATNRDYEDFVVRVFRAAFRNIKGKPVEIVSKKRDAGWDWKLVVAPYGFGRRYNIQAQPIDDYSDIMKLVSKRQEVCDGLEAVGLAKWSKKFAEFCDALPKGGGEFFDVKLSKPAIVGRWAHSPPEICDAVRFNKGRDSLELMRGGSDVNDVDLLAPSSAEVPHIFQILPDIPRILDELEQVIDAALKSAKASREALESGFGRELLISEV